MLPAKCEQIQKQKLLLRLLLRIFSNVTPHQDWRDQSDVFRGNMLQPANLEDGRLCFEITVSNLESDSIGIAYSAC